MATSKIARVLNLPSRLLSDESLTKKAYLNGLAAALDYGARLATGFLVTPWLVGGLGDYFYGTWQILNRLVSYISPASGRPAMALKWTLASEQASTDYEQKRRYVGSAVAISALFIPVMAILGGVLARFAPSWISAPADSFQPVQLATGLLVANLALTSLVTIPRSVLEGENLGYKRMGLSAMLVFAGGGLTWLALRFDTGIVGVSAATVVTTLLTGALFLLVVRTHAPWFGLAKPSVEAGRQFLGLSGWFLGWNLIMRLMMASDVVVLGMLASVESVTAYSLTKYAPEILISLIAIIAFAIAPGLGGIIGSGDLERAASIRREIMTFTWLVVTVLGSTILLWNRAFLRLWVGAGHYVGSIPALLIVLVVTQFVLIRNDGNVIDLTLRLRSKVLMGALSVTLSIAVAGILVGYFGLGVVGLCLGIMAGRSILSVGYPVLVGRLLGIPLSAQLRNGLRPALVTYFLFALASALDSLTSVNTWVGARVWVGLIVSAGATACGALLFAFYIGLSSSQRRQTLHRLQMIIATARPSHQDTWIEEIQDVTALDFYMRRGPRQEIDWATSVEQRQGVTASGLHVRRRPAEGIDSATSEEQRQEADAPDSYVRRGPQDRASSAKPVKEHREITALDFHIRRRHGRG